MSRRDFIKRFMKWCLLIFLAILTSILGKKIIVKKACYNCPEYSSCPGINSCVIFSSR